MKHCHMRTSLDPSIGSEDPVQKQPPEVLCKKKFLKNFANFTGKHLRWSLFLESLGWSLWGILRIKTPERPHWCLSGVFTVNFRPATLLKKILQHRCFPVRFAKFLRTPFLKNICKRLLLLVTEICALISSPV